MRSSTTFHPAIVTDKGLAVALESLAARAPLPVEVSVELESRLPERVEVATLSVPKTHPRFRTASS
jgi:hypothetical protein